MLIAETDLPDVVVCDLLLCADMAREGTWWHGGGLGEQPRWLVEAVRLVWADEARWKEQRLKRR